MESPLDISVTISFIIMIGLNSLATTLVWAEYAGNPSRYLKSISIGQTFALLWHCVSLWIVLDNDNQYLFTLSAAVVFVSALFYLSASLFDRGISYRTLSLIAATFSIALLASTYVLPQFLNWFWLVIMAIFLATPVATIINFEARSKWLVATLQTTIGLTVCVGIYLLGANNPTLGGLLYLSSAILVPMLSITYIIVSVRLSRAQILQQEKQYRVFFDAVNEVFFQTDLEGKVTTTSPSIKQFGIKQEDFIGSNLADYLFDPDSFRQKLEIAQERKQAFEYLGSFRTESGFIECEIVGTPVIDKQGNATHFAGAIRNTHERTLLEQQFIDAERHKSLAVLAGGIAHDFNNILQGIVSHTEILLATKDAQESLKNKSLNAILNASTAAGNLCRQLLQYTGKGAEGKTDLDLNESVRDVIDIINPAQFPNIEINFQELEKPALVQGDKSQISQIVLNLVRNAIDAVEDDGEIIIALDKITVDKDNHQELQLLGSITPGNYFVITVKDNGVGIPEAIRSQIFEPFFSTKASGHGLGLAAVTGILKTHRGEIVVDSTKGTGTEIKVFLPALDREVLPDKQVATVQNGDGRLILLVDDDNEIRSATSKILENAGNRVVMAEDGSEALRLFENAGEEFNLVITDIRMPKMDGVSLARKLKEKTPSIPIILTTGYADVSGELTSSESLRFQFIKKPYRADELLFAIDQSS